MRTLLDLIWDHHLLTMTGVYLVFLAGVHALIRTFWRPRDPQVRAQLTALAIMVALLPWLGTKLVIHSYAGGHAIAIAARMPASHPQLEAFERFRAAYDVPALNRWARNNRNPVSAGIIAKTQAALEKLPASTFKTQLEEGLATGYLSAERFEASALSIIQISAKELATDQTLRDLAAELPPTKRN